MEFGTAVQENEMLTLQKIGREPFEVPDPFVQKTPGVCGGDACIRKTRIPVWTLVQMHQLGLTDAEIGRSFSEPLSASDLGAAWAYFAVNAREIEDAIRDNEAE